MAKPAVKVGPAAEFITQPSQKGTIFPARAPVVVDDAPRLIEKDDGSGRLKRQIGRCLFLSRATSPNRDRSRALTAGVSLPALPIAQSPIGKARHSGFRMRVRNGGGSGAPESLPPKSEIGDGR